MGERPRSSQILLSVAAGVGLFFGSIGGATPVWAWGDLGHKIVCQIAFQELNDKAHLLNTTLGQ